MIDRDTETEKQKYRQTDKHIVPEGEICIIRYRGKRETYNHNYIYIGQRDKYKSEIYCY